MSQSNWQLHRACVLAHSDARPLVGRLVSDWSQNLNTARDFLGYRLEVLGGDGRQLRLDRWSGCRVRNRHF